LFIQSLYASILSLVGVFVLSHFEGSFCYK